MFSLTQLMLLRVMIAFYLAILLIICRTAMETDDASGRPISGVKVGAKITSILVFGFILCSIPCNLKYVR